MPQVRHKSNDICKVCKPTCIVILLAAFGSLAFFAIYIEEPSGVVSASWSSRFGLAWIASVSITDGQLILRAPSVTEGQATTATVPQLAPSLAQTKPLTARSLPRPVAQVGVIYGIETCSAPPYVKIVEAQRSTWAKNLTREVMIFVGGKHDDAKENLSEVALSCGDTLNDLHCKEAVMLMRAVERSRTLAVDWLAVSQDDKYIWTYNAEKALATFDPVKPQVLGDFGCGRAWNYTPGSAGKPMPKTWRGPRYHCEDVWRNGGLCGGKPYFVSRGALDKLLKPSQSPREFVEEMGAASKGPGRASDIFASCIFYRRGIPIKSEGRFTMNMFSMHDYREGSMQPIAMHLDAMKEQIPDYIFALDAAGGRFPNVWPPKVLLKTAMPS